MTRSNLTIKIILLGTTLLLTDCNTINSWTGKSYTERIKGKVKIEETIFTDRPNGKIYGTVTDRKTGEILKQANIRVLGTNTGAVTNDKGEFEIEVTGKTTLRFSYLGLMTFDKIINVKAGSEIKVNVGIGTQTIYDML